MKSKLTKDKLIKLLMIMLRAKMLEETSIKLFTDGKSPGWIHSGRGQEAVGAGVCLDLRPGDIIFPSHRGRAPALAKGMDFKRALAELCGKSTGVSKGRAGYDFLADKKLGIYNFTGSIGASMTMATGVALSGKTQRLQRVVVCFFGDGAANHGTFHECLNIAALRRLPVLYVCENNGWAQFTAQEWVTNITDVAKKAAGYGIPGITVDGSDVLAVYEAASPMIDQCRKGDGPALLECKTRRWYGHYIGDPQNYRSRDDIEKVPQFDPVPKFIKKLIREKVLNQVEVKRIEKNIAAELKDAEKFALKSPLPEPETALEHIYSERR